MGKEIKRSIETLIDRYPSKFREGLLPEEMMNLLKLFDRLEYPVDEDKIRSVLIAGCPIDYITSFNNFKEVVINNIK